MIFFSKSRRDGILSFERNYANSSTLILRDEALARFVVLAGSSGVGT